MIYYYRVKDSYKPKFVLAYNIHEVNNLNLLFFQPFMGKYNLIPLIYFTSNQQEAVSNLLHSINVQ